MPDIKKIYNGIVVEVAFVFSLVAILAIFSLIFMR